MAKEKKAGSRNPELIRGVGKFSRSAMYHKRGLWAIKAKHGGKFPTHAKAAPAEAAKKGREARFYPAEDVPKPVARRVIQNPTRLRCGPPCAHAPGL
jgi:large subunit ribosomal protein L6e